MTGCGEKLWEALERGEHYDLLFLDIELRNMNGVEVGKKIRDELEKETPEGFIRIHQSYLVNWIYVTHWKYNAVHIKQEHILPVSRAYRKNVSSFLLQNS